VSRYAPARAAADIEDRAAFDHDAWKDSAGRRASAIARARVEGGCLTCGALVARPGACGCPVVAAAPASASSAVHTTAGASCPTVRAAFRE
jgi:hypothetical protein